MGRGLKDEVPWFASYLVFISGVPAPVSWSLSCTEQMPAPLCPCPWRTLLPSYSAQLWQAGGQGCSSLPACYQFWLSLVSDTSFLLYTLHSVKPLTLACLGDILTPVEMGTGMFLHNLKILRNNQWKYEAECSQKTWVMLLATPSQISSVTSSNALCLH